MEIYRTSFAAGSITVTFLRDSLQDEELHKPALCSRLRDGEKLIYSMTEDPANGGVAADMPHEEREDVFGKIRHRGKLYYLSNSGSGSPGVRSLSENVYALENFSGSTICARYSSRFIYLTDQNRLYALDTTTMQFLPPLGLGFRLDQSRDSMSIISETFICSIAGVHDGMLTVRGYAWKAYWRMEAKLPEGYFEGVASNVVE